MKLLKYLNLGIVSDAFILLWQGVSLKVLIISNFR